MGKNKERILTNYTTKELETFKEECISQGLHFYVDEVLETAYGLLPNEEYRDGKVVSIPDVDSYVVRSYGFFSLAVSKITNICIDTTRLELQIYVDNSYEPFMLLPFESEEDLINSYTGITKSLDRIHRYSIIKSCKVILLILVLLV
jgi:hypothetical protein